MVRKIGRIKACLAMAGFLSAVVQSGETTAKLARGIRMGFPLIPAAAMVTGKSKKALPIRQGREPAESKTSDRQSGDVLARQAHFLFHFYKFVLFLTETDFYTMLNG